VKPPKRGAIIELSFNPQQGHEQAGYRPALVLSNSAYNAATGLMVACPITSQVKGYPLEVVLPDGLRTQGAVLVNQLKALDWQARGYHLIEEAPAEVLEEVLEKIIALLEE
jgi:mRNA interferase MazF